VPDQKQRGTAEHEWHEELCALAAGGLLEGAELVHFRAHVKGCSECLSDYQELSSLVTQELPQAQGSFRQKLAEIGAKPQPGSRQRFLSRARSEGVIFSREVETPSRSVPWYFRTVAALAPVAALIVLAVSLRVYHFHETPGAVGAKDPAVTQQIAELQRENSALTATLSKLNQSLATDQREIQNLRTQLGNAENLRRNSEQSTSHTAQLLDESRNQEKLLAEARDEAARSSQLRIYDEASLVEQQARITELTNKLRIASATLDQERQLAATGQDVRELMASRELHVIDVRDTDPNGNPSQAFGRVFLTEGKSLAFYAFDLNEDKIASAKRSFQVWAVPQAGKNSPRSLGFLHVDAKAQGRWVLKVDNPELVKEISSVFVTVEPSAGGEQPNGQKMLYAYLGEANHP
jgi:Anti-sigma-K factor rskA